MSLLPRRPVTSPSSITRASRVLLVLMAFVLTAATASAKSAGCTSVPTDFPFPTGATLIGGASTTINTFAAGEVITFNDLNGTSSITVTQGNNATIASFSSPGIYLASPITTAGIASVTVTNNGSNLVTLSAVCNAPSSYTVTVASDPATGTASNCTSLCISDRY